MAIKTKANLIVQKNEIKNETTAGANTALRNGTMIEDLLDSLLSIQDDLVNALNSTSTTKALTAAQGKALNDLITATNANIITIQGQIAAIDALIGVDGDVDSIVNTVTELLAVFQTYSEGMNIATEIAKIGNIGTKAVDETDLADLMILQYDAALNGVGGWKMVAMPEVSEASGDSIKKSITQATHGFVKGDLLRHNGTIYVKAQADTSANSELVGIVTTVTDANTFDLTTGGFVDITGMGLTANTTYFLSGGTAGLLTATAPTTIGHISKPVLITTSATVAYFFNFRGIAVVGSVSTTFSSVTTPTGAAPTVNISLSDSNFPGRTLTIDNTSTGNVTLAFTGFSNGTTVTLKILNNDVISRNIILPAGSSYVIYNNNDSKTISLTASKRAIVGITYDGSEYNITKVTQ